jgi:SAM-dependent methyltransferase
MNHVVSTYESYREEDRLTTNNARKIEFITTTRIFDKLFEQKLKILDCAAGTGAYAFYLADRGHEIVATDITPRHINYINEQLKTKTYKMVTSILDAIDMSKFENESFDVVLNMGPFYHLVDDVRRKKCLSECLRVLKKGGILVTAYIPKYYVFQYMALSNPLYLDSTLATQIINTGELRHDDEKCFWTDTYYASFDEMEALYTENHLKIIDHVAQDGIAPLLHEKVDKWTKEELSIWFDYHYSTCREKSTLGTSNHVIIIGRK